MGSEGSAWPRALWALAPVALLVGVGGVWALGLGLYALTTAGLIVFGLHAWVTLVSRRVRSARYLERLAETRVASPLGRADVPPVLVQVPTYEEPAVAARVIDAVAALDYPRHRLEIQILDDSRGETASIVDEAVARHQAQGVPIVALRRAHRTGFKAGALAEGLARSEASYVAIFDADFVPEPDFLRRALPLFHAYPRVACVQGSWRHLNRLQNLLTRAQAVAVDAHFRVQQIARAAAGRFLNFNGTAGVWRVEAIREAGGWRGDTLTEDLDLSYRAQLAGWRIVFDPDLGVPAELPPTLASYKAQQRRWACGSTQCARKYLGAVWRARLPLATRIEASIHLCGYWVSVAMTALVVLLPWALVHLPELSRHALLWPLWGLIWAAASGPVALGAAGQAGRGRRAAVDVALAVVLGLGACASNALAVLRGMVRPLKVFDRTPKQGARASLPRGAGPRVELAMSVGTLGALSLLPSDRPLVTAAYALTACLGFTSLTAYGWFAERRRAEAP
jgi:cellulose synthase/poly-beta-1,6-N-acetylglucosamine synthase-like glycosyltransferase